jgi:hypothetical protein
MWIIWISMDYMIRIQYTYLNALSSPEVIIPYLDLIEFYFAKVGSKVVLFQG